MKWSRRPAPSPQLVVADIDVDRVAKARENIAVLRNHSSFAHIDRAESRRVTNPQGPPNEGPSTWARPGNQGPLGQPPAAERIPTDGHCIPASPAAAVRQAPPPMAGQPPQQTEQLAAANADMHADPATRLRPIPPAGRTERLGWRRRKKSRHR